MPGGMDRPLGPVLVHLGRMHFAVRRRARDASGVDSTYNPLVKEAASMSCEGRVGANLTAQTRTYLAMRLTMQLTFL